MKRRTRLNPRTATGGGWEDTGKMQLDRLVRYGIKPEHTLFDLGCGTLRGGRHIIPFLNTNNYYGNDISQEISFESEKILQIDHLQDKNPHLFLTDNIEFNEVHGKKFDFIHAQSVLSHMPPEDIEQLFINVRKIMHSSTQFLATFFLSSTGKIYAGNQRKNFYYPLTWMQDVAKKYGLLAEMVESDKKQKLMRITLLTAASW